MQRSPTRIRWHQPLPLAMAGLERAAASGLPVAGARDVVREMLLRVGIPVVEGVGTAREFAIELLKLAAEVEHALMVQYLYAATSLPDEPGPDSVNYHEKLLDVAVQEMGHLATVQNLLLLLGGRKAFYMQRDIIRETSEKNPLPFVLEPINKASLAKYVAAEKPAQVPPDLEAKVDELVKLAEQDAGVDTHRVGAIFELLRWMFTPPEEASKGIDYAMFAPLPANPHFSDEVLRDLSEVTEYEALADEWQVFEEDVILTTAHTSAEARDAIDRIAAQGEGLTDRSRSHFAEFMEMVAAFEAGNITVKPIATSPTLDTHGGQGGEVISYPYTRLWGEVFSLQYSLLVLTLYHTLVTPRSSDGSADLRGALASLALRGMRRVIDPVSNLVASLPMRDDGSSDNAGPPYDLDASILQSNEDHELVAQHIRMLDRLASVYAAIESSPDFPSHLDHANTLANLRNFDKQRRDLFPPSAPPIA
jgi:Ferritin-like